jgi:hypothetical protein
MFDLLHDTFKSWHATTVTPRYLIWACACLLMLGVLLGFQVADLALRRRWHWDLLLPVPVLGLGAWDWLRLVYGVLKHQQEEHNG